MGLIRQYLKQKAARTFTGKHYDLDVVKKELKEEITHILYDQTRRTPIVIPVINEIGTSVSPNNQPRPVEQANFSNLSRDPKRSVPQKFVEPQVPDSDATEPRSRFNHRSY